MALSRRKMTDGKLPELIDLWRLQPALWDSRVSDYSNADVRKHAPLYLSQQIEGLDIGRPT